MSPPAPSSHRLMVAQILLIFMIVAWGLSGPAGGEFGIRSVLPPVLAIVLALVTRQVLPSLFASVFLGATMVAGGNPVEGFLQSTALYAVDAIADKDHAAIILFSTALSGMVGVMSRSGGSLGIVEKLSPLARTPKRAQVSTWAMGLVIFFDDYANTLLVGSTMRPLTDRLRISREKLAFIVDATAAPVAGLAAISTWVGFEVGLIQEAFQELGRPDSAYVVFLQTIPLRFYSIFCLFFVLAVCLSGRDFGPMLDCEVAARKGEYGQDGSGTVIRQNPLLTPDPERPRRWQYAVLPVLLIFFGTAGGLYLSGRSGLETKLRTEIRTEMVAGLEAAQRIPVAPFGVPPREDPPEKQIPVDEAALEARVVEQMEAASFNDLLSEASTSRVLLFVSFAGSLLALALPFLGGVLTMQEGLEAWVEGAKNLFEAQMILVLAWSLSHVCKDLGTAHTVAEALRQVLNPMLLPALTFLASAVISFATGSSWGTMSILMPMSIPLAVKLGGVAAASAGAPGSEAFLAAEAPILHGTIGAILAGSCFGDHCSPISDTTILSGIASGCDHLQHVRTQMPYALVPGATAVILGHIPAAYGVPTSLCIALGLFAVLAVLLSVGSSADELAAADPAESEAPE